MDDRLTLDVVGAQSSWEAERLVVGTYVSFGKFGLRVQRYQRQGQRLVRVSMQRIKPPCKKWMNLRLTPSTSTMI